MKLTGERAAGLRRQGHPVSSGLRGREALAKGALSARSGRGEAGFTLIEIMIVISIMVILLALVVPGYKAMSAQNQRNVCAANLKAIGQALALFREDYQCYPPDVTEFLPVPSDPNDMSQNPADSIHAAYNETTNEPIQTGYRGRGLFTLYYLGAYSMVLPPTSLEPDETAAQALNLQPRLGKTLRATLDSRRQGLNAFNWYRSGGYITDLRILHCPANPAEMKAEYLTENVQLQQGSIQTNLGHAQISPGIPTLNGWDNYDMYYRRNFWNPGTTILPIVNGVLEDRHLLQPYPPSDTPITWCPHHRKAGAPGGPGEVGPVSPGDKDLVLFADGSVHAMASRADNQLYREPPNSTGWPAGPVM
jgi:prepilin-type N-terminal cleavage/methylation domain-containing protein